MQPNLGAVTMKEVFRDHDLLSVALLGRFENTRNSRKQRLGQELSRPSGMKQISALWLNLLFSAGEGIGVPPPAGRVFHSK